MVETLLAWNHALAWLGVLTALATTVLLVDMFSSKAFTRHIQKYGLWVVFLMTLTVTTLALIYSEFFNIVPCGLCWLQRIALFPQVVLLGVALYHNDVNVARYGIALSLFGFVVGLYQHYLQMGGSEFIACPSAGEGISCVERHLFEFGFVTLPLLSAFTFAFLIAVYWYMLKTRESNKT